MKKLLFAMAMTFATTMTFAQLGLKGGVGVSNLTIENEDINNKQARAGYQVGVVLRLPVFDDHFGIQPEVLYSVKGAKYENSFAEVDTRYRYLDVPVLAVWNPLGGPLQIHAGPQFSRLLSVDNEFTVFDSELTLKDDRDNFEDWDFGVAVGLGLNFEKFFVDLRYTQGLTDVEKERIQNGQTIDPEVRNFAIQASVGFFLF